MKLRGFTLIELMVVIGIIGIILLATFVDPKTYYSESLLNTDALILKSTFEKTRTYIKTGFKKDALTTVDNGYGIYLTTNNPTRYIIYNDRNKNGLYDIGEEIESDTLKNSQIESINVFPMSFNLMYINTDNNTYINLVQYNGDIIIILKNKNNIKKTITINTITNIIDVE